MILETSERELEALMLEYYPGEIKPSQHHIAGERRKNRTYTFTRLNADSLRKFLAGRNYSYQLKDDEGNLRETHIRVSHANIN